MDEIDNPFDGEASRLIREQGVTEQQARDFVVLRHLRKGDTHSLAHWLEQDYCPGAPIRRLLSYMLQPTREDANDPDRIVTSDPRVIPYELRPVRRTGRRGVGRDPVKEERNRAILDLYDQLYATRKHEFGRGVSDSVIKELVDELGPEITESMIVEAIKKRSPKPS